MSTENEIFSYALGKGCCKPCCLRYICNRNVDNYIEIDKYIESKGFTRTSNEDNECVKKFKPNICIVCIGLLQDTTIDEILTQLQASEINLYDSPTFTCSISMPPAVYVREHSMRLDIEDKFPKFFTPDCMETPLNKVWKWIIKDKIAKAIEKKFESSDVCPFSINISLEYEDELNELIVLREMQPNLFKTREVQHRKYNGEIFSRKGVLQALQLTPSGVFRSHSKVPPEIPSKGMSCKNIEFSHDSIYMAGRYCKYSRELPQSPWIQNGVRTMETSVQEIIFEKIEKEASIPLESMKFASSGREDCDVRCLGNGRPFYIEILHPKKTNYTYDELRALENEINKSTLVKVRDLQIVPREDLLHIKDGEENKSKEYLALCVTIEPISIDKITIINNYGEFDMQQKTPIRVLHRRSNAKRTRRIYKMEASLIPGKDNMFIIKLTTQAGSYVKEFIHGDFQRTKPNLCDIIDMEVDILALDVVAINLDWPKPVDYKT